MRRRALFRNRQQGVIPTDKFTSVYSMDESSGTICYDSSGKGNHLNTASAAYLLSATTVQGQVGTAHQFNIQNRNFLTAPSADFSYVKEINGVNKLVPYSLVFWYKEINEGSFNGFMTIGSGGFYHFYLRKSQNIFEVLQQYKVAGVTQNLSWQLGAGFSEAGQYVQFALVFDPYRETNNYTMTLYKNAVKVFEGGTQVIQDNPDLAVEPFCAGGYYHTGSRASVFSGAQDEIKWAMGHALTQAEISAIYNSEI